MRRPHYIRPNDQTETPYNLLFFDTETHEVQEDENTVSHHLTFGYALFVRRLPNGSWSKGEWFHFETKMEFWDYVEACCRSRTVLYCFCHNTNFDLPVLDVFNELPQRNWTLKQAVIEGPPTILRFRREDRTLVFLDTLNWFRMPLAKLGEMVSLPKLPFPAGNATPLEWETYSKRDVEILRKAVCEWVDFLIDGDMGGFASTLAGQSMRTFRHKYMRSYILVHDNQQALQVERAAYYGGRNECFFIGRKRGDFHLLDINSMYPFVMRDGLFPVRFKWYSSDVAVGKLKQKLENYLVSARVTINTSEPAYPIRHNHKLVFPTGKFTTWLTTPELEYALEKGHLVDVHEAVFSECENIFLNFIEDIYEKRLKCIGDGKISAATQWKLVMNSLYGKFGQNGRKYELTGRTDSLECKVEEIIDYETRKITRVRQFAGIIQTMTEEDESQDSLPGIAAHVTAYARMYLWRLINMAGRKHVLYCDTDSMLVDVTGYRRLKKLIHQTELGKLKLEGTYREITINGCKDYVFGDKVRIKGIRQNAVRVSSNIYRQQRWGGLRGMVADGRVDSPRTTDVNKTLSRTYNKANVTVLGWTRPLQFPL